MKKLLLIAILMLALVVTIVACDKKPANDDTTVADTTVETPTEEPTAAPTEEPTVTEEPTAAPTDPEEPTVTDEPTEKPEDPTEPPTEEQTTADPADPVWIMDAEGIAGIANVNNATITGGEGYASLTANAGDPWIQVCGNIGEMPEYLAIRYRTNTNQRGEIFTSNGANPEGGKSFVFDYNTNGEWNLLIFHLPTVAPYMTANTVGHIRYDFFLDVPAEGTFLDVAYIAFFNTAEYALAYDFEQYPPYIEADDAAAGKKAHSFDTFYVNNSMYFPQDGGAGDKLTAQNNTISFAAGEAHESLALRGWIGFNQPIAQFGYFIDDLTMIYGEYTQATEDGVKAAGGEHASRFQINVPLADLSGGTHTVGFVVKLEDGTVVRLRENLKVVIVPYVEDEEIILAARAGGTTPLCAPGQTMGQKINVKGFLKQISVADMATYADGGSNTWNVTVWAWNTDYATTIAGDPLYSVDGENHKDNQTLNVMIPLELLITGEIYYECTYLSGSGGFTGWNAQGVPVEGLETYIAGVYSEVNYASSIIVGVEGDPNAIKMDSHNFQSNAAGNFADGSTADVDFLNSDLTATFTVTYGQGDNNHCFVKTGESGAYYWMHAFNSIRTIANGAYVFALDGFNVPQNPGFSSMVIRANMAANKESQLYGSDGHDGDQTSHGGSGIYLSMEGGNLIINIKGYVEAEYVSNKFAVAVDSNNIKLADNGETVYVIAGDKLVATIAISGTRDYGIPNVPADALAETVTITLADGTSQTVENAVVASRNNNGSLGVATRGGGELSFTAISLMPFDSIQIPGNEPETPDEPVENYSVPQSQWVITGHQPALQDGSNGMVAAGGVSSAALLHQGSIALGEIDLSKYSKVVIMWGCDNSQVTLDHYNANANNRIMLLNAEMTNVMSPAEGTIIAGGTYELKGWAVTAFEIDLTGIDYNGPVYVAIDTLPGTFALFASVEFIA